MRHVKNVSFYFGECTSDFHINSDVGVLFLGMSFHLMNSRYILGRLDGMTGYKQRILLLYNDREGCDKEMVDVSVICIAKNATLLVGFSELECARYIETLKLFEKKPADVLLNVREKNETHESVFAGVVTTIKSVNSSDAAQLGVTFGSMEGLCSASVEELLVCPGLGLKKAKRIVECVTSDLT